MGRVWDFGLQYWERVRPSVTKTDKGKGGKKLRTSLWNTKIFYLIAPSIHLPLINTKKIKNLNTTIINRVGVFHVSSKIFQNGQHNWPASLGSTQPEGKQTFIKLPALGDGSKSYAGPFLIGTNSNSVQSNKSPEKFVGTDMFWKCW